ncbi:PEP-CTERM sorting domain-containing protein [Pseudoduganella sp. FT26W]|uniref:PEP-CTERM sorting domain-containing protein n=1 Tax=Duganella aquatilis TaxID=2666082 RepID=A0A844D7P2_9BURK|nr:PEP-CTERM sorting domain-containing protein [Duganella aquatilis]MRW82844.1 PEP-CTERM sorting domain-containing protein [Duganella aquatilis]
MKVKIIAIASLLASCVCGVAKADFPIPNDPYGNPIDAGVINPVTVPNLTNGSYVSSGWILGYTFHLNQDTLVNALGSTLGNTHISTVDIWNSSGDIVASAYTNSQDSTKVGAYYFTAIDTIRLAAGDYTIAGAGFYTFDAPIWINSSTDDGSHVSPLITVTGGLFDQTTANYANGLAQAYSNFKYYNASQGRTSSYPVTFSGVAAAVPEPETYIMLLLGLAAVGAVRARRRS